jgi:hypothetical protein
MIIVKRLNYSIYEDYVLQAKEILEKTLISKYFIACISVFFGSNNRLLQARFDCKSHYQNCQ